tara:strand:- start:51431 stop:52369 length:939 start_codon:yes stop_codon:yes gene_type:complete
MGSYEKEMVLFYTNLWGSTGQPTFCPVSLETMAENNNNAALMLFFIHHLKGEEGNVINACKKVLNYVRPETPGSDIFDELPTISYSSSKAIQTEPLVSRPKPIFPSLEDKKSLFGDNEFPQLGGSKESVEVVSSVTPEPASSEDEVEVEVEEEEVEDIPEVIGVIDKEIREFKGIRVSCGKVPQEGDIHFIKFYIENGIKENAIFLTKNQIPDFSCIKRGSIYNFGGKFKYIESKKNWVLCDDGIVTIAKTRINGVQEPDKTKNSNKIITSQRGEVFFVSDKEVLPKDGPCSFELYKMYGKNCYSACNIRKL